MGPDLDELFALRDVEVPEDTGGTIVFKVTWFLDVSRHTGCIKSDFRGKCVPEDRR